MKSKIIFVLGSNSGAGKSFYCAKIKEKSQNYKIIKPMTQCKDNSCAFVYEKFGSHDFLEKSENILVSREALRTKIINKIKLELEKNQNLIIDGVGNLFTGGAYGFRTVDLLKEFRPDKIYFIIDGRIDKLGKNKNKYKGVFFDSLASQIEYLRSSSVTQKKLEIVINRSPYEIQKNARVWQNFLKLFELKPVFVAQRN